MKFVALLSGGKDSCYNIVKCIENGHELICVANLYPGDGSEEINSFMYQSAAHSTIPLLAQCFEVPLIQHPINKKTIIQSLQYNENILDEVEDMYDLLNITKLRYPDLKGVSCGAIVSSYQRFRLENVCNRLGLIPLTYLWQRNRHELLQEMLDYKLNAILVKVAGAGLDPYKHLGKSLNEMNTIFQRLHNNFGFTYF